MQLSAEIGTEHSQEQILLSSLGQTVKQLDLLINDKLKEAGIDLTKVQLMMLMHLESQDGVTQQELASASLRDKASTARLLDNLERKGLIVRAQSKEDKRVNLIYITRLGIEVLKKSEPVFETITREMKMSLEQGDMEQMIALLDRIQKKLKIIG